MWKNTLLLLLVSCTLLASTEAWGNQFDRLKNRVIHIETLIKKGRWLWQNDNTDADGSRYLYYDELAERDTYYTPTVQFQTTVCNGAYLCLESLSLPNYYLAAGFPAGGTKYTVKLEHSTYTGDDNRFHWSAMCEDGSMEICKMVPLRFDSDGYIMVADDWGSEGGYSGGHYDATLGKDQSLGRIRVHAPNPTDGFNDIYSATNEGTTVQTAMFSTSIGVTQTESTTETVTNTVSMEIGGAFKAFSASASSTIESSWATTESSTYEASKTVTHKLTIPGRTSIVLSQLIGYYAGAFDVGDDQYLIEETPLDGGTSIQRKFVPKDE